MIVRKEGALITGQVFDGDDPNADALTLLADNITITDCVFTGLFRRAIFLNDAEGTIITACRFLDLGVKDRPIQAVIHGISTGHEEHHTRIFGNSFERISRGDTGRIIDLEGGRFCTITGNGIGRCEGVAAAIRIAVHAGFKGSGNVISSNEIHNVGCPVVSLEGVTHTKVSGNVFTLLPKNHGATVIQDGACVGNEVSGNLEGEKP